MSGRGAGAAAPAGAAAGAPPAAVSPEAFLAMGRDILAQQPFSQLLGIELDALAPGQVSVRTTIREALAQHHGFVHGGAVASLADVALTFAGGTALRVPVITAEFKLNFVRPAQGMVLRAVGQAVHVGRTQAVCRCEVFALQHDGQAKLCAMAQGTIVVMNPARAEGAADG